MKNCLVTGGAGFIGSHLVERLLAEGCSVRVLDDFSSGLHSNLAAVRGDIEVLEGRVEDQDSARSAVDGMDTVFHLAAIGSVPRSIEYPEATHRANATGTLVMLEAAARARVSRFIFASSSSVYGDHPALPKKEEATGQVLSPYAVSKLCGEEYARVYSQVRGLPTVALRFFNVFGPRQRADHTYAAVVPRFLDASLQGKPITVNGDGLHSRDFTYVANNVDGIIAAARAFPIVSGRVFNLACEGQVTLLELIEMMDEKLPQKLDVRFGPERVGDIQHSFADIGALREATGYEPRISVSDGVTLTLEWFIEEQGSSA